MRMLLMFEIERQ